MEPSVTNPPIPDSEEITPEDIEQMLQEFFKTMLGMPFGKTGAQDPQVFQNSHFGTIEVKGAWRASLRVTASKTLCNRLASIMFDVESAKIQDDDVKDALGELANVLGGNVKGKIDKDCDLTIPEVNPFEERTFPSDAHWFESDGEILCVELSVDQ